MNNSSAVEVGKVRFNEFDGLLGTPEEDSMIKSLHAVKVPGNKLRVVFLKGFSTGINWSVTVDKADIKSEERDDLESNTGGNLVCKQHFIKTVTHCNSNSEFLIIWDGDNYDNTCYTEVIPELLRKISANGMSYTLIAYRSAKFEEFKNSWLSCPDIESLEINIVKGPLITGNHYEDLAIFSREKTSTFLNPSDVNSISIFLFGGGPILEAELTPRLPFESTEIIIYNVTRVRGEKGSMYFQRNYIFKDSKYSENGEISIAKYFRVKKDQRAICKIENASDCLEEYVFSSKNSSIYRVPETHSNCKGSKNMTKKEVGSPRPSVGSPRRSAGRPRGSRNKSKRKSTRAKKSPGRPKRSVGKTRRSVGGRPKGSRNKRSR